MLTFKKHFGTVLFAHMCLILHITSALQSVAFQELTDSYQSLLSAVR